LPRRSISPLKQQITQVGGSVNDVIPQKHIPPLNKLTEQKPPKAPLIRKPGKQNNNNNTNKNNSTKKSYIHASKNAFSTSTDGDDEAMYDTIFAHSIKSENMRYCSDDKPENDIKQIVAPNTISSTLISDNFVNRNSLFGNSTVSTSTSYDRMPSVLLRKIKSKDRKKRFSLIEKRFGTTKHTHQPTRTQKQLLHDLTPKWQRPIVKKKKKPSCKRIKSNETKISSTREALRELSTNGYKLTGGSRSEWDIELLKPLRSVNERKTLNRRINKNKVTSRSDRQKRSSKLKMKSRGLNRIDNNVNEADKNISYKLKQSSSSTSLGKSSSGRRRRRRSSSTSSKRRNKRLLKKKKNGKISTFLTTLPSPRIRTKENKRERISSSSLSSRSTKNSVIMSSLNRTGVFSTSRAKRKNDKQRRYRNKSNRSKISKSSSSILYNKNYKSIYDRKTPITKYNNNKKPKKLLKSPRKSNILLEKETFSSKNKHINMARKAFVNCARNDNNDSTFLTSLLDNSKDENTSIENVLINSNSLHTQQRTLYSDDKCISTVAMSHDASKQANKKLNRNHKKKDQRIPSKFGQQSSTFLTASLFEPFDGEDVDCGDSPSIVERAGHRSDTRNLPTYIKTHRNNSKSLEFRNGSNRNDNVNTDEDLEEVVDRTGGLTTGLGGITKGFGNSRSAKGKGATRRMLGLSINSKIRGKKRHAWMSKSVLKQQDSNRRNMLMPYGTARGSVHNSPTLKKRQWSASRINLSDNNSFHSYSASHINGKELGVGRVRSSKKRHNNNKGVLIGAGLVRRVSR
jgi:hypothetical protein